eukprot:788257-Rhodomonas_salina.2
MGRGKQRGQRGQGRGEPGRPMLKGATGIGVRCDSAGRGEDRGRTGGGREGWYLDLSTDKEYPFLLPTPPLLLPHSPAPPPSPSRPRSPLRVAGRASAQVTSSLPRLPLPPARTHTPARACGTHAHTHAPSLSGAFIPPSAKTRLWTAHVSERGRCGRREEREREREERKKWRESERKERKRGRERGREGERAHAACAQSAAAHSGRRTPGDRCLCGCASVWVRAPVSLRAHSHGT